MGAQVGTEAEFDALVDEAGEMPVIERGESASEREREREGGREGSFDALRPVCDGE